MAFGCMTVLFSANNSNRTKRNIAEQPRKTICFKFVTFVDFLSGDGLLSGLAGKTQDSHTNRKAWQKCFQIIEFEINRK